MKTFFRVVTRSLVLLEGLAPRFLASERGSVAIMLGVSLSVMMGIVALGTEMTFVLYKQRQMQAAADSAALGAATALSKGYPADFALEARAIAATGGFVNGAGGATVTINKPPLTGSNAGVATAIEVIITQPQALRLVSLFSAATFNVNARAVALKGASGSFCAMSTDTGSSTGISVSNGATVNFNQCGLAVNGSGSSALSVVGGATLNVLSVTAVGQAHVSNGGRINATDGVQINQPATSDPYAGIATPASAGCANNNKSIGWAATTQYLTPGTYCGGLSVGNGATVHFNPGTYYIKSGSFTLGGGATVTGSGVTIVLTRNTSGYATASIANGVNVTLSAPTSGTLSGILFFSDRDAPTSGSNNIAGGATVKFTGALYFPTQRAVYSNGATTTATCTQLIAWRITFAGGVSFNNDCGSAGTSPIGGGAATTLVE